MTPSTYATPICSPDKMSDRSERASTAISKCGARTELFRSGSCSAHSRGGGDFGSPSPPSSSRGGSPTPSGDDAVKVVVRIRPMSDKESSSPGAQPCVSVQGDGSVLLHDPARTEPFRAAFDAVLDTDASQEDCYLTVGAAMVDHCMAGFNSSIFAYGQTGSGKTHTMLGDPARSDDGSLAPSCGLVPRVFDALFAAVGDRERERGRGPHAPLRYSVKCSFLEIYNEEITDLLSPGTSGLQIRDGDIKKGVYVQGLTETEVLNADDVLAVIARGSANRRMAATRMNERSSRSHSVFTATIEAHERTDSGLTNVRYAKLNLIDLAGSERVGRSGAEGQQLAEAKSINRSLAVLGRVMAALVERQKRNNNSTHVPYRDSRLTFLLQESLGGNSRTCIVANVTPAVDSASETYSTLTFAAGAKKITCRAVVNEDTVGDLKTLQLENAKLQRLVAELQNARDAAGAAEVAALHRQLEQVQALFDQNNSAITALRAEQGVLRRELSESKAAAARLADEAVQLRADNSALSAEAERLREERDSIADALDAAAGTARGAEESRRGAEADKEKLVSELESLRREVGEARSAAAEEVSRATAALAEAQAARAAAAAALEEARNEVARVQREAREEAIAAAARIADMQRETEEAKSQTAELETEVASLRQKMSSETTNVAKYKRMVGEIGRLIDWAQTSAPGAAAAAAAAKASVQAGADFGSVGGIKASPAAAAALRVARLSLSNGAVPVGGGSMAAAASLLEKKAAGIDHGSVATRAALPAGAP